MTSRRHTAVVMLAIALLVAAGCAGSGDHRTANLHHHYFLIGKRLCAKAVRNAKQTLQPSLPQGTTLGGSFQSGVRIAIDTHRFPQQYRHDVAAGCQAAVQTQ